MCKDGTKKAVRFKGAEYEAAVKAALRARDAVAAPAAAAAAAAPAAAASAKGHSGAAAAGRGVNGDDGNAFNGRNRKRKSQTDADNLRAQDCFGDGDSGGASAGTGKPASAAAPPHSQLSQPPSAARPLLVVRDKNIAKEDLWKAVGAAQPSPCIALVFGGSTRDFGGDVTAAAATLSRVPPVSPWELSACMWRVMARQEHPSIVGDADITPGLVCQFALRLAGNAYCTVSHTAVVLHSCTLQCCCVHVDE
jgi:hypothetical protein